MPLSPGDRLGPYEILAPLGAGGMGEVYRATDTRLGRTVAIKVLPAHLSDHPDLRQRFDREARAISSLSHPHICTLYDVGEEAGISYLVMEHLEGESLAHRLDAGALPLADVLRLGRQMAEALAFAHRHGVVHRDLKPGNVMLTPGGAKLLDFGLAKMSRQSATPESSMTMKAESDSAHTPLTAEGTLLGTFQYMAPEQLEGNEADARSDIFALGAVLYEMSTGRRAFSGKTQASLIASILKDQPPPISSFEEMTPPALDRVVRICLEKDPEARWQTAHDVALQLAWIAEGGSEAGAPRAVARRRRGRERTAWVVAALLGLAALGLGARELLREPAPEPATVRFRIPPPSGLSSLGTPRISPDGRIIAFDATDSTGALRVWIQPLNTLTAHALEGTEDASRPFWSPDSRSVAFFAGSQLKRMDVAGGQVRVILDGINGADGTWGPDGTILFDGSLGDSIQSVPAGGGLVRPASRLDRSRGQTTHAWPRFLPDGRHFLFLASHASSSAGDSLMLGELGTFETRTLGPAASLMDYCPPGFILWVDNGLLLARRFDCGSLSWRGEPFPVTTRLATGTVGLANFSVSRNGILAYRPQESNLETLTWMDRAGRPLQSVGPPSYYFQPDLEPGGSRIAVEVGSRTDHETDIRLIDESRGTIARFTYEPGREYGALWSPDGSRIAYLDQEDDRYRLAIKGSAGTSEPEYIAPDSLAGMPTSWSPDAGTILVNVLSGATIWDIWAIRPSGDRGPTPLAATRFAEIQPRFSPDGRFVAYASNETQGFQVYVVTYPDFAGKWQISTTGGLEPQWRADGRELYYLTPGRDLMAVDIETEGGLRAGRPRRLFPAEVPASIVTRNRYAASPDGQRFLLVKPVSYGSSPITVVLNWAAEFEEP